MFFSRTNSLCWLLFGVCSIPVLLHWHIEDPGHSAKSASGRLPLNTYTSLTQQSRSWLTMLSRHSVGTYQGNEPARNPSRSTRPQSSQLVEPLWTKPGLKSKTWTGRSAHLWRCVLVVYVSSKGKKKEKKSAVMEWIVEPFSEVRASEGKSHHQHFALLVLLGDSVWWAIQEFRRCQSKRLFIGGFKLL